jgi:hypothetical protein
VFKSFSVPLRLFFIKANTPLNNVIARLVRAAQRNIEPPCFPQNGVRLQSIYSILFVPGSFIIERLLL